MTEPATQIFKDLDAVIEFMVAESKRRGLTQEVVHASGDSVAVMTDQGDVVFTFPMAYNEADKTFTLTLPEGVA